MLTIGNNWASCPDFKDIEGVLSKLITSDEPYPTPLFSKWTEITLPLKIGCISASKVFPLIEEIPILPFKVTVMSE